MIVSEINFGTGIMHFIVLLACYILNMAVYSKRSGPVLAGPVFTFYFKIAHAQKINNRTTALSVTFMASVKTISAKFRKLQILKNFAPRKFGAMR